MPHLTKILIDSTPPPDDKHQVLIWDDELSGFGLRVTRAGAKSFILQMRTKAQRMTRVTLGAYKDGGLTVEQARRRCIDLKSRMNHGEDPVRDARQARQRARDELTFAEAFALYLERHASVRNRDAGRAVDLRVRQHLAPLLSRKLSAITRRDVSDLHRYLTAQRGPIAANLAIRLLRGVFNKLIRWELFAGPNPAANTVDFNPEPPRTRVLTDDELERLRTAAMVDREPHWRAYFLLMLEFGNRKQELLRARWEDVDLKARVMRFPVTKSGEPHSLPLTDAAVALLRDLPSRRFSEWVFAREERGSRPASSPEWAWRRIKNRANIPHDVRIHDLRRTVGTRLAVQGNSAFIIKRMLNHASSGYVTDRYVQPAAEAIRDAMEHNSRLMAGGK